MIAHEFNGPVFVVGMSRSGTKLVREILNRHSNIRIPQAESHFIPYLLRKFKDTPLPFPRARREELKKIVEESRFYHNMRSRGWPSTCLDFEEITTQSDCLSTVIESLLRSFCVTDPRARADYIWGDKTPNHLVVIEELKRAFPKARFVHVIRDPRERALSAHKAWGANLYIAADRWVRSITRARAQGRKLAGDYYEVFYEKLTDDPRKEVPELCEFLGIEFETPMLSLNTPIETLGDSATRTTAKIVRGNVKKYMRELRPAQVRRIEEIAYPAAVELGYLDGTSECRHKPMGVWERQRCLLDDRTRSLFHYLRLWGLRRGFGYLLRRRRISRSIG